MNRTLPVKVILVALLPLIAFAQFLDGRISTTVPETFAEPTVIHLPAGFELDTRNPGISLSGDLMLADASEGVSTYLVKFDGPVYESERGALEATGAVIDGYLPNYTYTVRMDGALVDEVSKLSGVQWVGEYHPGYKISPELDLSETGTRELVVLLYAGTDGNYIREVTQDAGGSVIGWHACDAETVVRIMLAPSQVDELVKLNDVKWVEPHNQVYIHNQYAQWVLQTWNDNDRRVWDEGITGEGQVVNVLDSGIRMSHNFYHDSDVSLNTWGDYPTHRKVIGYKATTLAGPDFGDDLVIGHGTHTCGSVAGNDQPVGGSSPNIGMAPDAKIFFLDGGSDANPYGIIPGFDLEATLNIAYAGNSGGKPRISSNSWGGSTRTYNSQCVQVDRAMWNRKDFLILFSAGNNPPAPYTGAPGNAKNVISVGATKNGVLAAIPATFSSPGPSGDGRIRPDVVAPGEVTSAKSTGDDAEEWAFGTSMSCPVTAGNVALIRQYFMDGYFPGGASRISAAITPSGALMKAMVINSVETGFFANPVPSDQVGWGRPNLDNVLYFDGDKRTLMIEDYSDGMSTGQEYETTVYVSITTEELRVTLVWVDYPGQSGASPALVNDLNLEVISPTGTIYKGNVFGDEDESVAGGSFDALNPTENVFIDRPETGTWSIKIHGNNVPQGPQPFALVVTGAVSADSTGIAEPPSVKVVYDLEVVSAIGGNPSINFTLTSPSHVSLEVWDASGRRVEEVYAGDLAEGSHKLNWDTANLAAGIYFVTLNSNAGMASTRAVVLK